MWMKINARSVTALMMMMSTLKHGLAVTTTIVGDGSTIGVLVSAESQVLKSSSPFTTVFMLILLIFLYGNLQGSYPLSNQSLVILYIGP